MAWIAETDPPFEVAYALGFSTIEDGEVYVIDRGTHFYLYSLTTGVWTGALTVPVQLPDRAIPYDKELVIKAWHTNTGVIMVAPSLAAAVNVNSGFPLIASGVVRYKIRNANRIWICCHPTLGIVGDGVACTAEQEAAR